MENNYSRKACAGLGVVLLLTISIVLSACDTLFTKAPTAGDDFESPFDGLSPELNELFLLGDENFERVFLVSEGLGPIFNNTACVSCHPGDGRGSPNEALVRFSLAGDLLDSLGGPQLQDKAIPGVNPESLPAGVESSLRLPPPVFGVGLIEMIPVQTILALVDSNDTDLDGISGRPNWVIAAPFVPASVVGGGPGKQLGRFGRKANVASLLQQVTEAYHQDMGVTSDFMPVENRNPQSGGVSVGDNVQDPELSDATVLQTTMYVRLLAPPARGEITAEVQQGKQVFENINCVGCHVPSLRTSVNNIPSLSDIDAELYSDLLLHDMGPALADGRPDGEANGNEWRTAPLWGTRLVGDFLNGKPVFLHDGRATSLDEAIRLHGGEAETSKQNYIALDPVSRSALIAFLESL